MRMRTPLTRRFTVVLLLVLLTACHSWQPTTVSPQQLIEEEQPDRIRVTRPDSTTLVVTDPTVVNDSIATVLEECQTSVYGGRSNCRVVEVIPLIAVDDVASLEVRRVATGRTIRLVVLVPATAYGLLLLGFAFTGGGFPCSGC